MDNYKIENKKGQGTYSIVYMATNKQTNQKYALKIMKQPYQNISKIKKDKQIKALHMFNHPNIIRLIDVLYDSANQKMALVFELMDGNLYQYYKNKKTNGGLSLQKIKNMVYEILQAVDYIHKKGIFHRDIKPENILVKGEKLLKLADFGSCKNFMSEKPYTEYISTRWYRAPQCLMTDGYYSEKMDVWSVGCILFQLFSFYPLFPGKSQSDQIRTIFGILGTPSEDVIQNFAVKASHMVFNFERTSGIGISTLIPEAPQDMLDLLHLMLEINPSNRISVSEALSHRFFSQITQLKKYQGRVLSRLAQQKQSMFPPISKIKKSQYVK